MFLYMSVGAPAQAMWQAIKQSDGYCGYRSCTTGEHLATGPGKRTVEGGAMCTHLT